jgi:hypothetical protein
MAFLKTNSVDAIVASFTKTIGRLRAAAVYHSEQETRCSTEIGYLQEQAETHNSECNRATCIATKLEALLVDQPH